MGVPELSTVPVTRTSERDEPYRGGTYAEEAADSSMDETTFGQTVLSRLQPHYDVYREVHGQHFSGKTLLLDVINPKLTN